MFGKKRKDYTQKLFDVFMTSRAKGTPYTFSTDDAIVLTTSDVTYKTLLKEEKYKNAKNKIDGKPQSRIVEYKDLGLGRHEISKDIILRDALKNAILFGELEIQTPVMKRWVGGNHTIIITSSPERLKDFVGGVVKQHMHDFGITDESIEQGNASAYPYLFTTMSLDNNLAYDGTLFETPEDFNSAVKRVVDEIEKKSQSQPEEMGEE